MIALITIRLRRLALPRGNRRMNSKEPRSPGERPIPARATAIRTARPTGIFGIAVTQRTRVTGADLRSFRALNAS
ncbi:hypothetical protein [Actinokineospora sp. UTMC 2448]|uniref:hypothetical protein n=1 Tax=Actinokineospora sp. UTMC 2448 TaxID=2268449 RepID=UPI0021642E88|nr:hypothetical protein [Actinokineospora sp. UTMC 2448]